METQTCRSIRDALLRLLGEQVEVAAFDDFCIVTLPLRTADSRYIDVFVESKLGDFVLVHDGGKSTAELYAQGIHLTDARVKIFGEMAHRYGVAYADGTFSVACRSDGISSAVLAIAQCASLAMFDVLSHFPVADDEPVLARLGRALDLWKPPGVEIARRVPIKGQTPEANHVFDYVAFASEPTRRNVAVKVLMPTYGSPLQAQRYGFLALDIRGTMFDRWPRLAVIARADQWVEPALRLVRSLSTRTLELESGDEGSLERLVPGYMDELAA
jgi:hypothetical protein